MRLLLCASISLVLIGCASCTSFEAKRKTEAAVEQAANNFHEQLNQEQYHDIYSQADRTLQDRLSEADFTSKLRDAHEKMGPTHNKAIVIIDGSIWRGIRNTFGSRREIISHWNMPDSSVIIADERFSWAVENDEPKLVSYEMRSICRKPCRVGFGVGPGTRP